VGRCWVTLGDLGWNWVKPGVGAGGWRTRHAIAEIADVAGVGKNLMESGQENIDQKGPVFSRAQISLTTTFTCDEI
jgi:hypothetical protein